MKIGCCGLPVARARCFASFPVVQVQRTFYDPPSPSLAAKWRNESPAGFEYALLHAVDPFRAEPVHGRFRYLRLHGMAGYRSRYTPGDRQKLPGMGGEGDCLFFSNGFM